MSDLAGRSASVCLLDDCGVTILWPEVRVEDHWEHVLGMTWEQEGAMAVRAALHWQAAALEHELDAHLNEFHPGLTRGDLAQALARWQYERHLQALG